MPHFSVLKIKTAASWKKNDPILETREIVLDRFKSNRGKWDILKDPFWGLNLRVTLYKFFKSLMGANVPDP